MQLLIIRHGIAEDAAPGGDDSRRELTSDGEKKMKNVSAGLATIVENLDVIGASPLVRAKQTAEIVAEAYGDLEVQTVQALSPGSEPSALVEWLGAQSSAEVVAIVGHEPHLSTLVTWFMTGGKNSRVELKKGGAALLEFSSDVSAGGGLLQWLLTPSQLRRIGK